VEVRACQPPVLIAIGLRLCDRETLTRGRPPAASAPHQHLVSNDMHDIHPEHLQRTPDRSIWQARHQALRWSTFRAAFGLLSERRAILPRCRELRAAERFRKVQLGSSSKPFLAFADSLDTPAKALGEEAGRG